jgi:hypothetical protein
VVFLAHELVMASFGLPEHILERVRSAVVGQQVEIAIKRTRVAAGGVVSGRLGVGAKARGKQDCRSSLAAANKKVTAAQIDGLW